MQNLLRVLTVSVLVGTVALAFDDRATRSTAAPVAIAQPQTSSSQSSSSANTAAPQVGTSVSGAGVRSALVVPIHIYESPQIISTNPDTVRFSTNRSTITVTNQAAPPRF